LEDIAGGVQAGQFRLRLLMQPLDPVQFGLDSLRLSFFGRGSTLCLERAPARRRGANLLLVRILIHQPVWCGTRLLSLPHLSKVVFETFDAGQEVEWSLGLRAGPRDELGLACGPIPGARDWFYQHEGIVFADFQFNRPELQAVTRVQRLLTEAMAIQPRIQRQAAGDRSGRLADDQALQGSDSGCLESQGALGT
jgi:hypothetical protein